MEVGEQPNYRREYWKSKTHKWWAFLTLGLGFISAEPLWFIAGVTAYILGWIYLPDLPFFRRWVNRRIDAEKRAVLMAQTNEFIRKRDAQLASLTGGRRNRYNEVAQVCKDVEKATEGAGGAGDPSLVDRLRKLEELMWTYLRLLMIEQSLETFLETERREDVPRLVSEAEQECQRLSEDVEKLKTNNGPKATLDYKQRLLNSRLELLDVLRKRLQRAEQARENLSLAISEQQRMDQQIKLIRADAVASRNADVLTARIDASFQHLEQTNKWLSELSEFKDVIGDMPPPEMRIGFGAVESPPPVPEDAARMRAPGKLKVR